MTATANQGGLGIAPKTASAAVGESGMGSPEHTMDEAKKRVRKIVVRITPKMEKLLRIKMKPYLRNGFTLDNVKAVYKRGVVDYVIFPRSGIDRLAFALARVTSYLTGTGTKDQDLMPGGFQARTVTR